jgi:hypothetical protein
MGGGAEGYVTVCVCTKRQPCAFLAGAPATQPQLTFAGASDTTEAPDKNPVVRSRAVRGVVVLTLVALVATGCGGERQDANEPEGDFTLSVLDASFPANQSTAQRATLRLQVRNTDDQALPNVAVTIKTDPSTKGAAPTAFGQASDDTRLADPGRPVWIVDRAPEGGQSAYTNTWAFGPMSPGETRDFEWRLTAVRPGTYTIRYAVSPGLNGKAKVADGQDNAGSLHVTISDKPVPARVNGKGEVVREPTGG